MIVESYIKYMSTNIEFFFIIDDYSIDFER